MYVSIYFLLSNGVLSGDDVDAELLRESCILLSLRSLIVLTITVPKYLIGQGGAGLFMA